MLEVIKRIDLCYSNASVILTPVQNDAGSRFLIASLTSEGEPYTIPEGCTVQLAVRKPDGTKTLTAAIVKDNTVVCELTNQSLAVKGIADAQIIIYNGLAVLKTPPFKLNIFEQIVSDDAIVSTDEFTALSEIMKNYQEISAEVAKKLNKSGGVMSGNIDMAGNKIENIALPVADNDAASKKYIDDKTKQGRLIYQTTLTEDVRQISISKDSSGQEFLLNNIAVIVCIPASPTLNTFAYLGLKINNFDVYFSHTVITKGEEGKKHVVIFRCDRDNGIWSRMAGTSLNQSITGVYTPSLKGVEYWDYYVRNADKYEAARNITLSPTGEDSVIPKGTKIEVYGR